MPDLIITSRGIGTVIIPSSVVEQALNRMKSSAFMATEIGSIIANGLPDASPAVLRVARNRGPDRLIQRERGNIRLIEGRKGKGSQWIWIGSRIDSTRLRVLALTGSKAGLTYDISVPVGTTPEILQLIAQGLLYKHECQCDRYEIFMENSSIGVYQSPRAIIESIS